jgi:hypothetical protein
MELAAFLCDEHDMSKSSAMELAHLTRELLQRLGEGRVWFRYRKEDGTIREAVGTLCPGISDKFDRYEVKGGVAAGSQVVVAGASRLQDGAKVQLKK